MIMEIDCKAANGLPHCWRAKWLHIWLSLHHQLSGPAKRRGGKSATICNLGKTYKQTWGDSMMYFRSWSPSTDWLTPSLLTSIATAWIGILLTTCPSWIMSNSGSFTRTARYANLFFLCVPYLRLSKSNRTRIHRVGGHVVAFNDQECCVIMCYWEFYDPP